MCSQCKVWTAFIGLILVGSLYHLNAQGTGAEGPLGPPTIIKDFQRLRDAAMESDYAFRQTAYLADRIGPRMCGSPQFKRAAVYVAEQLKAEGLEVRLEPLKGPCWIRGREEAELVDYPGRIEGTAQRIVLTTLGGSVATPSGGITAEVVPVSDFEELKRLGRDKIAGRIVLFSSQFDSRLAANGEAVAAYDQVAGYRGKGASAAASYGATAVLIRSLGGADFRLPHTGCLSIYPVVAPIPAAALAAEDADLIGRLAKEGPVRLRLLLTPRVLPDAPSWNVVADIKGCELPDEVVVVSGHLDSWDLGTGALDDAVGVAMAMETAHLIHRLGLRPRRTIRIIAWGSEEWGPLAGLVYTLAHEGELPSHYAAIESDLGAGHPMGILYNADHAAEAVLDPIIRVLSSLGTSILRASVDTGTDIYPMSMEGVPTFAPLQDIRNYFDYHHSAADTFDKVPPHELREGAAMLAVLAFGLASADRPIPHVAKSRPAWFKEINERFRAGEK